MRSEKLCSRHSEKARKGQGRKKKKKKRVSRTKNY